MPGKLKVTGSIRTPRDPQNVRAYCEGRQYAKGGGSLTYATATTGVEGSNNGITWTAKIPGNGMEIDMVNGGNSQVLAVSVQSLAKIRVSLGTNSSGVVTSTAAQVIAAVAANTEANAIVGGANTGASTGAAAVAVALAKLTGSNFGQVISQAGIDFAAGISSWTADPTGVKTQDCCALPYGGGHV
jgi:hypothetical protein